MEGFKELLERYSALYGHVHENKELYTDKHYKAVVDDLYQQYSDEYNVLFTENDISYKEDLFDAKFNHAMYVPWRFLCFGNKIGKLRYRELLLAFNKYYDDRLDKYLTEFNEYKVEKIKKSLARRSAANVMRKECQSANKAANKVIKDAKRAAKAERKATKKAAKAAKQVAKVERKAAHQNAKAEKKAAKKAKNAKK